MEYNKTKRGLEKAAGIIGIVFSAMGILGYFIMFVVGCLSAKITSTVLVAFDEWGDGIYETTSVVNSASIALIVLGLLLVAFCIISIVFCAKVIKNPVRENGEVINTQKTRICVVVFSFISGNLISAGMEIAVLCLKDYEGQAETSSAATLNSVPVASVAVPETTTKPSEVPETIAEIIEPSVMPSQKPVEPVVKKDNVVSQPTQVVVQPVPAAIQPTPAVSKPKPVEPKPTISLDTKVGELLRLRDLGIIDDEIFNKAIDNIALSLKKKQ